MAAMVSLLMTSCGLSEIGGDDSGKASGGSWGGPLVGGTGGAGALKAACCVTALDYRRGYDWRADVESGAVKCSLSVYVDGIPKMKVPVGMDYEAGADPDMHRIVDGYLFTDCSIGSETVIKKDGSFALRYPGREIICGLELKGDDIYTLGRNRDGDGFSLRKNGEPVVVRERGTLMGGLVKDKDSLCFAFSESIRSSSGYMERYYVAAGGKVSQIAVRDDVIKVFDIMPRLDQEVYIARLSGVPAPVLINGRTMTALDVPAGCTILSCSLFAAGNSVGTEGICQTSDGVRKSAVWLNGHLLKVFDAGYTVAALCVADDGVCCVMNPAGRDKPGKIYKCGDMYDMPEGYVCMGDAGIAMINGLLYVGLSSVNGAAPVIWKDGLLEDLEVNGYIATIQAFLPK